MKNPTYALIVVLVLQVSAHAQLGQYDNMILDGGGNSASPFLSLFNARRNHILAGFEDYFGIYVNNGYKFTVQESAIDNGFDLNDAGAVLTKGITINHDVTFTQGTPLTFQRTGGFAESNHSFFRSVPRNYQYGGGLGLGHGDAGQGSGIVLWVFDSAKEDTLSLNQNGVGVGTQDAEAALHVKGGNAPPFGEAKILVQNSTNITAVRDMFELVNKGGSRFTFTDTSIDSRWEFSSNGSGSFSISKAGTGGSEMRITPAGRVIMGPGGAANMDLRSNGNLIIAGTLSQSSDRNMKTAFQEVSDSDVLRRVSEMPVTTWQFKHDGPDSRHMGPTAQDFRAAFGLGENDTTIAPVDGIGVSLSAIKALNQKLSAKDDRINQLQTEVEYWRKQVRCQQKTMASIVARLEVLESNTQ